MHDLSINGDRLWTSLQEMACIGATNSGGVCRLALTDLDREARDLFVKWCRDAGCVTHVDRMGNIFARREGTRPSLPPVMTGSHLDTQPSGGKFDGAYGVLAGLEIMRTLNDAGHRTRAPLEVAVWTNEEGSRFAPAMVSSGVFAGAFDLAYGLSRADVEGKTLGEELARIGYAGDMPVGRKVGAFFEAHIEQGPILEAGKKRVGVVTGAQGQRWYEITLVGEEAHAGSTPMAVRRDALLGASAIVVELQALALANGPDGRATVGYMQVSPNSRNTIPGRVSFTVDLRHPVEDVLSRMDTALRICTSRITDRQRLAVRFEEIWHSPALTFDYRCVASIRTAADRLKLDSIDIISGAGHDACYLNRIAPTGMVFIPCERGLSHNEAENISPADAAAGAQVLLLAMLDHADAT